MEQRTGWVPLDEVAVVLETTRLNVLMHIKRGFLQGESRPSGWCVTKESLEKFLAAAGADRPRVVCQSGCSQAAGCGSCQ